MSGKDQHVYRSKSGGWAVRSEGASRASKIFPDKKSASGHANTIARDSHSGVYTHKKDGTIQSVKSYKKRHVQVTKDGRRR
jgi:hypothetical protein